MFTARVMDGTVKSHAALKSGTEQLQMLTEWYREQSKASPIGFFQIGGGIAGDFAICAVPMLIRISKRTLACGLTFRRSAMRLPVMVVTQGRFPTRRSLGTSFHRTVLSS